MSAPARRRLSLAIVAFVLGAPIGFERATFASSDNEAAAGKLREQAIAHDYLATDFAEAERKLLRAISLCDGASACSRGLRARLHCDLGVVDIAGQRRDEGRAQFAIAVEADPHVAIDRDVSTPELEAILAEVRGTPAPSASARAETPPAAEPSDRASDEPSSGEPTEGSDCPPAFPGCHSAPHACNGDEGCSTGQTCREGSCVEPTAAPLMPPKANWIQLAFQQDLLLLDSKTDVCAGGSGYTCFDNSGNYYGAVPYPRADDAVNGGLAPATMRILLGYDRVIAENVTVGARLGYALGGGPTRPSAAAFLPLHAEARATLWFGHDPLARAGLRFFVVAATGITQVDAALPVKVYDSLDAYNAGRSRQYQAWHKTGLGFGALGGGAMYAFSANTGLLLEVRGMELFPTPGTAAGVQLGYAVGL